MTRLSGWRAAWCALILALLATPALVAPAEAATVTVSGTVTLPDGTPVAGARVLALSTTTGSASATTTSDGGYEITGLPSGSYRFETESDRTVKRWYGGGESKESAAVVAVGKDLHLDPVVKPAGQVVITYAGAPNVSVEVRVSPTTMTTVPVEREDQRVRLWMTTEDPLLVGLKPSSSIAPRIWLGGKYAAQHSTPVQADSGEVVNAHIDFPEWATITGRTLTSAGFLIKAGVRTVVREDGEWVPVPWTTWSGDGEFSARAPAGAPVSVVTSGTGGFGVTWLGGTADPSAAAALTLAPGESYAAGDLVVPGGNPTRGVVVDSNWLPLPGVTITAFRSRTSEILGTATSTTDGTYAIPGIGEGETGPLTLRYSGEHLTTVWSGDQPDQAQAATVNATTWPRQRVEHDAAYRLQTSAPPTVTGSGFVSTWMEAAPGTVVPTPGRVEFQWRCGSSLLGTKGPRLYLADYLDGCQVSVQQTSTLDGYASSVAVSAPVTVRSLRALTPGSVRAAVAGQRMAPTGVTWNLVPSRVSYQWLRDGSPVRGATAATYVATTADVGHRMAVRLTAYRAQEGATATSTTIASPAVVARSALRARATGYRHRAVVSLQLTTPGASRPAGMVTIRDGGRVVKRIVIGSTPRSATWTYRGLPRGWKKLTLTFTGSTRATPTRTAVRVYVR